MRSVPASDGVDEPGMVVASGTGVPSDFLTPSEGRALQGARAKMKALAQLEMLVKVIERVALKRT